MTRTCVRSAVPGDAEAVPRLRRVAAEGASISDGGGRLIERDPMALLLAESAGAGP
jgi:hypothetical protein